MASGLGMPKTGVSCCMSASFTSGAAFVAEAERRVGGVEDLDDGAGRHRRRRIQAADNVLRLVAEAVHVTAQAVDVLPAGETAGGFDGAAHDGFRE